MHAKYVILCNEDGGVLNDPVLLRVADDEFWFSLADSDIEMWLRGVNLGLRLDVSIAEIDVAPVQIQGPKSEALMVDLFGERVREIPYYGLMEGQVNGRDVVVSQTGFTGEKGYEIYLKDATLYAEDLWYGVLEAGERHQLMVTAPAHHRRIAAGILSWGQDLDHETLPFQCNLGYQVPRRKQADYVGKRALEAARRAIDAGSPPFRNVLVGIVFGGRPVTDYANDFWLISFKRRERTRGLRPPLRGSLRNSRPNIALAYVPWEMRDVGTRLSVSLPAEYAERPGEPVAGEVVDVPFRPSVNPNIREVVRGRGRDSAD